MTHRPGTAPALHAVAAGWAVAAILAALPAAAQTPPVNDGRSVYRCADGRYTDTPCPGGQALDASDPRSDAQRQQAGDAAARDARLADRLAAERRARDQAAQGQRAANLTPRAASQPASQPRRAKKAQDTDLKKPRPPHTLRSGPPPPGHPASGAR